MKSDPNDETDDPKADHLDPKTRRIALLKEFDRKYKKVIKGIHNQEEDPLRELGPGISTYHQLLMLLFLLFLMLTLIHIPVMNMYQSYDFFKSDDGYGYFEANSLGNLGFSETQCLIEHMMKGNQASLKCNSGRITTLIDAGFTTRFEDQMQCSSDASNACKGIADIEKIRDDFLRDCQNKQSCLFEDFKQYIYQPESSSLESE
jgi:hypothetical protein